MDKIWKASCRPAPLGSGNNQVILQEFPLASPSGTPSGKALYLTVYPLSRPNTDTVFSFKASLLTSVLSYKLELCLDIAESFMFSYDHLVNVLST